MLQRVSATNVCGDHQGVVMNLSLIGRIVDLPKGRTCINEKRASESTESSERSEARTRPLRAEIGVAAKGHLIRPLRRTYATSWVRLWQPNLRRMLWMCVLIVPSVTTNFLAI